MHYLTQKIKNEYVSFSRPDLFLFSLFFLIKQPEPAPQYTPYLVVANPEADRR